MNPIHRQINLYKPPNPSPDKATNPLNYKTKDESEKRGHEFFRFDFHPLRTYPPTYHLSTPRISSRKEWSVGAKNESSDKNVNIASTFDKLELARIIRTTLNY